jgi:site-specific DNA-methyltransferase (adenine-specific)
MPAHYSLLVYTRHPHNFTHNQLDPIPTMDQCFRAKCISKRLNNAPKEKISDIWYDIHRIKHKKDRDEHPCQLPLKLLERVILISTNPGDLILDPFMGTGTTAFMAQKLGRHFSGIEIDPIYRDIALGKMNIEVDNEIIHTERNEKGHKTVFESPPRLFDNS